MIKLRALKKRISSGFDGHSKEKESTASYEKKHKDVKSTRSSLRRRAIPSTRHVETELPPLPSQEYTLTKETPETHEQLLKEMNFNRKHSERYYIYDFSIYRGPMDESVTSDPSFDIFEKKDGLTPTSARYVIHYLTQYFKETLIQDSTAEGTRDTDSIKSAIEIFKPNLSHFSTQEIGETTKILKSFFPWDGCSLTGKVLEEEIRKSLGNSKTKLILALRIIWSHLQQGIIPWEAYLKFCAIESKQNFSKMCFYNFLPRVLPDHDYTCCAFEFLEILVAIISKVDMVVDKLTQMDLIFTAGQVCFVNTPDLQNYIQSKLSDTPDLIMLGKLYQAKGEALYRLFVSYLRSLVEEGKIKDFYLIDTFKLDEYPPKPYKPITQRALTLTVPQLLNADENNFNELITIAAKASTRIYSSNHTFTKFDNTFLDKFEEDPYKVINSLFSRSSKRYLYKFDEKFDPEQFKNLNKKGGLNSALQSIGPGDQYAVATWINSCKERGFNDFLSVLDDNNFGEGTLALGHSNFKSSLDESPSYPSVRISKMDVSEWFISSWKYETFLGKVKNTLVIKLTKRIADCEWLIITTDERVGSRCYLTPSKSTDSAKEQEWAKINTPPLPSKDRTPSHTATPSISSSKSRPPPPSLLGEPSSSPLIDSSLGLYPDTASSKSRSRHTSHSLSPKTNASKHNSDRRSATSLSTSSRICEVVKVSGAFRNSQQLSDGPPALHEIPEVNTTEQQSAETCGEPNDVSEMETQESDKRHSRSEELTKRDQPKDKNAESNSEEDNDFDKIDHEKGPESLKEEPQHSEAEDNKKTCLNVSKDETKTVAPVPERQIKSSIESTSEASATKVDCSAVIDAEKEYLPRKQGNEAGLLSPLLCGAAIIKPSPVGTPVDRAPPGHLPKGPMKIQNPSMSSFADTTVVSSGMEDHGDTSETTRISNEFEESSPSKKVHPYSVMLLPPTPGSEKESERDKGIIVEEDAMVHTNMTGDLLSDLLDNYNSISVDPRCSSNELTVFEQVRLLYEHENSKQSTGLNESAESLHEDVQDLDTSSESSDPDLGSSKTATWFSCNVTLPTHTKRTDAPGKTHLPTLKVSTPQTHDKIRRVSLGPSEFPDDDGLWPKLDSISEPATNEEVCSPTQSMIRNVVLRTKRSIRGLRDKKTAS